MPWPSSLGLNPPTRLSVTSWDTRYFESAKTLEISRSVKSRVPKRLITCSKEGGGCFMGTLSALIQDFDGDTSPICFPQHRLIYCARRDSLIASGAPLLQARR